MDTDTLSQKKAFSKEEKLCRTKSIDRLFSSGESFIAYPLRVVFYIEEEVDEKNKNATVLISISKKKFKRAVKRNRVKRLFRESYRLNKQELQAVLQEKNKRIDIAFLYLKNELPTYTEMEKAVLKSISILVGKINEVNI